MKMLLLAAVLASAALVACTGSNNSAEETSRPTPCPACPVCPACPPAANPWSDYCAGATASVELWKIVVDMAHEGAFAGTTETEESASLAGAQEDFDQHCQGVPLADPSSLTSSCAAAGKWEGSQLERERNFPNAWTLSWYSKFHDIINDYCEPPPD
jgi:hypothetical protein